MDHGPTRRRFDERLAAIGAPLGSLTPRAGLEIMVRLCDEMAGTAFLVCAWTGVSHYAPDAQGFAWTLYRRHEDSQPPEVPGGPLGLLFRVDLSPSVDETLNLFSVYDRAEDSADFWSRVEATKAFQLFGDVTPAAVALEDETVERRDHELFDCWSNRDPARPVVTMTEAEWLRSTDVGLMLRWFRQQWTGPETDLDRLIQRYLLACCRRVWPLLPLPASRHGVEVTERYIDGEATRQEFADAEWNAEGAAFYLEDPAVTAEFRDPNPGEDWLRYEAGRRTHVAELVKQVETMPPDERDRLAQPREDQSPHTPWKLLESAAYFVDAAMCYPGIRPKESIERYRHFLSAPLLREVVGNPFR